MMEPQGLAERALTTFWEGDEPSPPEFGEGWTLQETRPTHPHGKMMFAEWTRPPSPPPLNMETNTQ